MVATTFAFVPLMEEDDLQNKVSRLSFGDILISPMKNLLNHKGQFKGKVQNYAHSTRTQGCSFDFFTDIQSHSFGQANAPGFETENDSMPPNLGCW